MEYNETPKLKDSFPIISHITDIYFGNDEKFENEHMPRFEEITKRFQKIYGEKPKFFARAPGKVNLGGDDIMLENYPLLRFSIEQDTIIAYSVSEGEFIEINHILPTVYPTQKISTDPNQKLLEEKSYINYILAGYKAALCEIEIKQFKGLKVLVTGNIPIGAGLGSSTSLLIASGLMTLQAYDMLKLTERKAFLKKINKFEAMLNPSIGSVVDQIVIAYSQKDKIVEYDAKKEELLQYHSFLQHYSFVIADSLTPTSKVLSQGSYLNKRIVECKLAAMVLAKELQIPDKAGVKQLKQLQDLQGYSFADMQLIIDETLSKDSYKFEEIESILGAPLMKHVADIPYAELVLTSNFEFFLKQRAKHVIGEAERAEKIIDIITHNDPAKDLATRALEIGKIMTESQQSYEKLFDASSEQIKNLITVCDKFSCGTRIAGQGWGGSCISLIRTEDQDKAMESIMNEYYLNKQNKLAITDDLKMYVFCTNCAGGACIIDPNYEFWY